MIICDRCGGDVQVVGLGIKSQGVTISTAESISGIGSAENSCDIRVDLCTYCRNAINKLMGEFMKDGCSSRDRTSNKD